MNTNRVSVKNPWYRSEYQSSRQTYEIEGAPVFQYRGVSVYRLVSSWLYVLGDTAITERAGFKKEKAAGIITGILDGAEPSGHAVLQHLRANGHKGIGYDEYQSGQIAAWPAAPEHWEMRDMDTKHTPGDWKAARAAIAKATGAA
jgi:hypothetical protein